MNGVNESDWKLFRKKLPGWQEVYMGKLNQEYAAILAGSGLASEKFWKLEIIKYIFRIRNSFYKGAVAPTLPLKYNKNAWMAWSILLCRYDPGCCF